MTAPQYIAICYWPKTVTRDAVWNPAEVALGRKSAFDAAQEHLERTGFREPTQVQVIRINGIEAEDVTAEFLAERFPEPAEDDGTGDWDFQRREAKAAGHFA